MTGTELIAEERKRQIAIEGWTPEHDDAHVNGEMPAAASTYTLLVCDQVYPEQYISFPMQCQRRKDAGWPWDEEWWKPSPDPIRNLVKAGALIAAEIDRLQRKAGKL